MTVLIWLAMSFLVDKPLMVKATLKLVPLTVRLSLLLLAVIPTGPVVESVLVTATAVASPAERSTAMEWVLEAPPFSEISNVAVPAPKLVPTVPLLS